MADNIVSSVLNGVSYLFDALTYIPYKFSSGSQVSDRVRRSQEVRAVQLDPNNPLAPWRHVNNVDSLTESPFPDCYTICDLFNRSLKLNEDRPCFGTRPVLSLSEEKQPDGKVFQKMILGDYEWQTYKEVNIRIDNVGRGLLKLNQQPKFRILIFAETRADWAVCMHACFRYNFPIVTLYATLGEEAIVHGITESEVTHVITSAELLPKFKTFIHKIPKVTNIIYMDGNKPLKDFKLPECNVTVTPLSEVENIGSSNIENFKKSEPKPHDIAVIMYTSGSTGIPKGVLISHYNILCAVAGLSERIFHLCEEDVYIAYLPLAHILELTCEISLIAYGASLGFGSPLTLTDKSPKIKAGSKGDLAALRPTLMAGVPLVLDRLFKLVWENVNAGGFAKRVLFKFLLSYKRRHYNGGSKTPLCDALIFKKLNAILGGRLRMIASGGAPLSAETQNFITLAFCFPLGQGYGLTETCGAASLCELSRDLTSGHVGPALRSCELRLRDWSEGGYTVYDKPYPRGEILVGGGNVAMGYFKNDAKTAEDFLTLNGIRYFCTGDIGEIDDCGRLKIIDRKKDLVKLQAGEYISLGKVETLLKLSPLIDNICVYADSYKDFAVALIVPNHKALENLGKKLNKLFDNYTDLIGDDDVKKGVKDEMVKQAKASKLLRTEIPQRITIVREIWLPETGLVTAAMKLKRKEIQTFYSAEIERMYND